MFGTPWLSPVSFSPHFVEGRDMPRSVRSAHSRGPPMEDRRTCKPVRPSIARPHTMPLHFHVFLVTDGVEVRNVTTNKVEAETRLTFANQKTPGRFAVVETEATVSTLRQSRVARRSPSKHR